MSLSPIHKPRLLLLFPPPSPSPSPSPSSSQEIPASASASASASFAASASSHTSWDLPTTSFFSLESKPPPITSHTSPVPDIARSGSGSGSGSGSISAPAVATTSSLPTPPIGSRNPSCHSSSGSDRAPAPGPETERPRIVFIDDPDKTQKLNDEYNSQRYSGNKVRTSKYTLLSFFPRNLFEQFRRVAYLYFLTILCLNQIPQLAVFTRYASAVPLGFVLLLTALKDGYEDWRRHRSDEKENNRMAMVLNNRDGEYIPKPWKHIRVGEVVKVHAHETIPCDLLLLKTSDPTGLAYVQTINLDGESNLKTRYARLELAPQLETTSRLEKNFSQSSQSSHHNHNHSHHHCHHHPIISGRVVCEKPNRNIYGFTAYVEIDGKQIPLGPTNIILRGCELKNTSWTIGVVIYAGQETKVMLNSAGAQSKRSRLESNMNRETLWLSVFLLICCLVSGLGMGLWLNAHKNDLLDLPYYGKTSENYYGYYGTIGEALFAFLSSLISFQIMIPISLYISMELVRLGQSYFMIHDVEMYHSETDSRFQCRDLSINEDLGQIKYLFSDKTGTLTENKMEFRNASIFGRDYTHVGSGNKLVDVMNEIYNAGEIMRGMPSDGSMGRAAIHDYFLTLAACNTVVPTKVENVTSNLGTLELEITELGSTDCFTWEYQGESPDEQALVSAAASYGFRLLSRTSNHLVIDIRGETQKFEVLGMHEFDSNRKCMSVVLKFPDESIKVFVKGADSTVLNKIKLGKSNTEIEDEQQSNVLRKTQIHLAQYSEQGLRTLVVAARELSVTDLNHWKRLYGKANASLKDRQHLLNEAAQVIEKDLTLLGATGIEDKLQKGVPDAIATLREAGIKIWVLTGDKQETAISIGHSCALLTNDMKKIIINESEKDRCLAALRNARATYVLSYENRAKYEVLSGSVEFTSSEKWKRESDSASLHNESRTNQEREMEDSQGTCRMLALIIDGNSLVHALETDLEQELYDLATACRVVICCRVAPLQKAGIVSLVKRKSGEMTLAIGDGANDVSMIQMADVGVGISGQEGRQAVLASDFALGQFRFLKRLLLVHGRLNYQRLGSMVLYNFYRNAVFIMLLFWYMIYAAFSTSPAITQWSLVLYSIIYTSVPTIIVAILDRDLDPITLLRYPPLYKGGQNDESYNKMLFWLTMLDTLWQSMILFYVPYLTYKGGDIDIWSIGSVWTISVVVLVNVHLGMDVQHFTWITHLALWGSIAATYVCIVVLDVINDETQDHYWVIFHVASRASYWLNIVLIVILALLPRFVIKIFRQMFKPSDAQIVRENEILLNTDRSSISSLKKT